VDVVDFWIATVLGVILAAAFFLGLVANLRIDEMERKAEKDNVH
jgi:predicted outer membrane lipoprotein